MTAQTFNANEMASCLLRSMSVHYKGIIVDSMTVNDDKVPTFYGYSYYGHACKIDEKGNIWVAPLQPKFNMNH